MAIKKTFRVKREKDFTKIFYAKNSFANKRFIIYQINAEQDHFRVGVSVSKKLGNAVMRNRIKRLIRHAVAEYATGLEAVDFVVIARSGVQGLSFDEVKKNILHLLKLSKIYSTEENNIEKAN